VQPRLVMVVTLVMVMIARATIEAAQQAVALRARLAEAPDHPIERNAEQHECMRGQHQAGFEYFGNDFSSARPRQALQVAFVGGANYDRHVRPRGLNME